MSSQIERIPVAGPSISDRELAYVAEAAANGWFDQAGGFVRRFEDAFAKLHQVPQAISLPSCTSGIHLALAAAGIGPPDEVIVPEVTWIASAAPISYVGATPVFADVDSVHWGLTVEAVERCRTPRTRAVIVVDLYGDIPELEEIVLWASDHNIMVIEDAAQAIGSFRGEQRAGTFGDVGVFSFHGSKTMTTGEGGMAITADEQLHDRMRFLADHGRVPGDTSFRNSEVAFKYKMSNLQAALGLGQLERLDELVDQKRRIHQWYCRHLAGGPLSVLQERIAVMSSFWMTCGVDRNRRWDKHDLIERLGELGVDCRPVFTPLSELPAYAHLETAVRARADNHGAREFTSHAINLPSALNLTESDVVRVAELVRTVM